MSISDPVEILVSQNRWANEHLIEACRGLAPEQFHQTFEMGLGSLHNSIVHIVATMRGWGDLLAGREQRPRLEGENFSLNAIAEKHDEVSTDFESWALSRPVDEIVTGERGGTRFSFHRGGVITHVTTHGMHHRAQCLNMLRHLGVDPLPPSSVVEWMMMAKK